MTNSLSKAKEYQHSKSAGKFSSLKLEKYILFLSLLVSVLVRHFFPVLSNRGKMTIAQTMAQKNVSSGPLNVLTTAAIFGICFVLTISMKKRKIFHHKGVTVFIIGIFLWLLYGFVASVTGLFVFVSAETYRELLSLTIFCVTMFLLARIIIAYGWKRELVMSICLGLGMSLLAGFILNIGQFDRSSFIASLGNIFLAGGRYRISFGLGHVNSAGSNTFLFIILSCIYRQVIREESGDPKKNDKFNKFFLVPVSYIAFFMLMCSGSRSAITRLILFFMVLFYLTTWKKIGRYIRVLFFVATIFIAIIVVSAVNWDFVLDESGRMINYISVDVVIREGVWLAGLGFAPGNVMQTYLSAVYIDGYYLYIFLQSGFIGFILLFGAMFLFTRIYFQDSEKMTRLQIYTAGMLITRLYGGLFDSFMFGHGPFDLASWAMFIIEMNGKSEISNSMKRFKTVKTL